MTNMAESNETTDARNMQVIELHMMDKRKYYPLALISGTAIRTALYPLSLVKTRLQVQHKKSLYNGTYDAFRKIIQAEGVVGLYRGYWVNSLLVLPQLVYVSAYEGVRQYLGNQSMESTQLRSFIAGGCASICSQTFVVPIDIVTQHMMLLGGDKTSKHSQSSSQKVPSAKTQISRLKVDLESSSSKMGISLKIMKAVYSKYGIRGFYKGYFVSLLLYCPHSALWWFSYDGYSEFLAGVMPESVPRLVIQAIAGPLAGITATFITNPLDVSRTRLQVSGQGTMFSILSELWRTERFGLFTKAVTARMTQSVIFSFMIITGYETVKRWSLLDDYKAEMRW